MKYRPEIDGLRAIAVIPVVLFHSGCPGFSGGFVGVDVFFVISGYLIANILAIDLEKKKFNFLEFWERRARRILPALFGMIACTLPFAYFWMVPGAFKIYGQSLLGVVAFSSNIFFWQQGGGYFEAALDDMPLLHTWSLAVEEQFYILFPAFFSIVWSLGRKRTFWLVFCCLLASLAVAEWAARHYPNTAFYMAPSRAWELLLGVAISIKYTSADSRYSLTKELAAILGIGLILISVFAFSALTPWPGMYALAPTIGTGLVIAYAKADSGVGKVLANKVLVGIGLISYSLYLWHQPLFAFARTRAISSPSAELMAGLVILSLVLAYFSWRCVEQPFRSRQRMTRARLIKILAPIACTFLALGICISATNGYESRLKNNTVYLNAKAAASDINPNSKECLAGPHNPIAPENACRIGELSEVSSVALWGDSHADTLAFELGKALQSEHLAGVEFASMGCIPIVGANRSGIFSGCSSYSQSVLEYLRNHPKLKTVVMLGRYTENFVGPYVSEKCKESIHNVATLDASPKNLILKTVGLLQAMGKHIILVGPVPEIGCSVPLALQKIAIFGGGAQIAVTRKEYLARNEVMLSAINELPDNIVIVDPAHKLCGELLTDMCKYQTDDHVLYSDGNHLSNAGAALVVPDIMKSIVGYPS